MTYWAVSTVNESRGEALAVPGMNSFSYRTANASPLLKESIDSFDAVYKEESDVYTAPLSIRELHEFLTVEGKI